MIMINIKTKKKYSVYHKHMHIDHIEIRNDIINFKFPVLNFDTIRYRSNFLY
jgi:hypothetical protein